METLLYTLRSASPLVMHNGQLADPLNHWSKAIKKISGKRNKTDADHEEIGRLEWHGNLYVDTNGCPCIPGEILEATLVNAAKKVKRGPQARAGILADGNFPLQYEGPKSIDMLWDDGNFIMKRLMTVQRSKIVRTLPLFPQWQVEVHVTFDPTMLNRGDIEQFMTVAGSSVGLMEFRPRFGRFLIV